MVSNNHEENCAAVRPTILVFSHLRWDFVFQRPQQILTRAADDYTIYFIEEPIIEGETFTLRESPRAGGVVVVQPIIPHDAAPLEALRHQTALANKIAARAGSAPIYLWYYAPMALTFGQDVAADLIIFDKMDELSAFAFAPPALRAWEAELMASADLVFTGGASLHAAAVGRNPAVHCFPSSIDTAHFGKARAGNDPDPDDQFEIAHPRLGFFGVIDERMDLALIADVAALRPDWQLVMIGPTAKIDPATLPQAANIHWLGSKDYARLPEYMAHWDLGWMPFALNEATRFISPTKTPEFLAAGLPLLSTAIHDVVEPYGRIGLVEIADNASAMVAAGDRLLAEARQPAARAMRRAAADRHLKQGSWDSTWAAMRALIESTAAAPLISSSQSRETAGV
jgi:Glycosyl transferases group 1